MFVSLRIFLSLYIENNVLLLLFLANVLCFGPGVFERGSVVWPPSETVFYTHDSGIEGVMIKFIFDIIDCSFIMLTGVIVVEVLKPLVLFI